MPRQLSGDPWLDDAMAQWGVSAALLPPEFRNELARTLDAVERGELTLVWCWLDEDREDFRRRFHHPFARAYDHAMLSLTLSLGLPGPDVRMHPVGGVILRRHLESALQAEEPRSTPANEADRPQLLRELLASITSDEVPDED